MYEQRVVAVHQSGGTLAFSSAETAVQESLLYNTKGPSPSTERTDLEATSGVKQKAK